MQGGKGRQSVALNAHIVDFGATKQLLIVGAMGHMARRTALRLDWQVLEGEWTAFFRVALEADLVLRGIQFRLLRTAIVYVVTIAALYEPFVDAVMEGAIEIGSRVIVAAVAQLGCFRLEEKVLLLRMMRRVTRGTGHVILEVI